MPEPSPPAKLPVDRSLLGQKTFCMLPWVHANVGADGKVLPCGMGDVDRPVGDLQRQRLSEVWNSRELRALRTNMLEGKVSPHCAKCYELDRVGFPSLRSRANADFARHFPLVETTGPDGRVDEMRMAYMDLRFSNVCNFRCRTCCAELSSAWFEDSLRLGRRLEGPALRTAAADAEALWREVEALLPGVEEIHFTGGEPLLMEEHYRILDWLVAHRRFEVRLLYNTNFFTLSHGGRELPALWDRFETVRVGASLDAMGARGEYLRKGQDWEAVVRNRERMMRECPRVHFTVSPTVSLMNVLHLPDFHREWVERGYIDPWQFSLNLLQVPPEYRVQVLPPEVKRRAAEKIASHLESGPGAAREPAERFRAVVEFMNAEDRTDLLWRFWEKTAALDEMRGERFVDVFPELREVYEAAEKAPRPPKLRSADGPPPAPRPPILDSPTFCMAPWVHLNVRTDGAVLPCCMAERFPLGDARREPLAEAWNSAEMRWLRSNMLAGRPSPHCVRCYELDRAGFPSLRTRMNKDFAHHFPVVERTRAGRAPEFRTPYLDVKFSNVCNFRCRTCGPEQSSAWHEDAANLGLQVPAAALVTAGADPEDLWRQVEALLPSVEEISFAGGEPLLMEEHYRILDWLLANDRRRVRLVYNTNFSTFAFRGRDVLGLWNEFEDVRVSASLDAMGARGEYLRKGQDWAAVLAGRERMISACPRVRFLVGATVSAMNVLHVTDLHADWVRRGFIAPAAFHLNLVQYPEEYRVQVLPPALKRRAADKIEAHLASLRGPGVEEVAASYRALVRFMDAADETARLPRFRESVAALDRLRGERFPEVFPELAELFVD